MSFCDPQLDLHCLDGVQEFFCRWMLINRREPYESNSGRHRLLDDLLELLQLPEKQFPAPQIQGSLFLDWNESSHVFRGLAPVDRRDSFVQLRDCPVLVDRDLLLFPRPELVDRRGKELEVDADALARVPEEVVPVASLDVLPAEQDVDFAREETRFVLHRDCRHERKIKILELLAATDWRIRIDLFTQKISLM